MIFKLKENIILRTSAAGILELSRSLQSAVVGGLTPPASDSIQIRFINPNNVFIFLMLPFIFKWKY